MGETIFSHAKFAFSSIFFSLVKIQPYLSQVCSIFTRQEIIPKHQCAPPADFAFVRSFFFVSVRRAAPDLNSAPFSLYQQVVTWYNGGTFFCSSFFLLPFFYIKARRASSDRQHCTFDCTVLQETDFFFLPLTDKKRLFDCKFVFRGPRIMYLRLDTSVVKI